MKRVLLFFLLTIPFGVSAQIVLTNGSFSNGYIKGSDGTFTVTSLVGSSGLLSDVSPPTTAATNILFTNVYSTQMQVSFTPGNGTNHLVVIRSSSAVNFIPQDGMSYSTGNVGSGNSIVSNDSRTTVQLTGLQPATNYFVTIYEFNSSTGTYYLVTGAPVANRSTLPLPNVYVITPANGAINQNVTLNVTSIALSGAITYTIELNDAADFTGTSFIKSGSRTQNFSGLIYGKTYFTRVKTNLSPDYGNVTSFSTNVPIVQVTAPANGAINQKTTLNVTSSSLVGASLYTIELNEAADFSGAAIVQSGTRTQNFSGLKYDQQYFTHVMTDNYPVFGPSTSFHTAIPNVYVTNPANGAINTNVDLNVTANTFAGATTYTIELNTAADFSGTGFVQTGARTQNFSGLAFAKTYYARVKTDVSPVYGNVTSFTTAPASWFAYVTSPKDDAVDINNTTLNITSNLVPNATSYTIQLSETSDFASVAFEVTGNSRTLPFSGLKYNTTYFSQVTTDVSTEYGQTKSFTTRTAESLAYVTSPANDAIHVSYNPKVTSHSVPGATYYTIQLSESPNFTPVDFEATGTRTLPFSGLKYNTLYYCRVQTELSANWGAVQHFTTGDPLSLAYVLSPVDGATGVPTTVVVKANVVPGATSYKIELNTASDFSGISFVKSGSRGQSFTLVDNTTYFTRVQTNFITGWGSTGSFTTINPAARSNADWVGIDNDSDTTVVISNSLKVFPNPFTDKFTLLVEDIEQLSIDIELIDLNGIILKSWRDETNHLLEIKEELAQGIYILKVKKRNEVVAAKVLKL